MSNKLFAALCVLGAVLLASQTVTCADDEQSDNQYIVDEGSDTPVIVTEPAGGDVLAESAASRSCSPNLCNTRCRSQGYKKGACKSRKVCTCFKIAKLYTMEPDSPILNPYSIVPCIKSVCSASCKGKGQSYGECIATVSCNCS